MTLILLLLIAVTKELSNITFDPLSGANTTSTTTHTFTDTAVSGSIQWEGWELLARTRISTVQTANYRS